MAIIHSKRFQPISLLFVVVIANYLAQIPYYFHQYYHPYHLLPSLVGTLMLLTTLVWFLAAYRLLVKGNRTGWWLMLCYLSAVFLFYIQTQVMQLVTVHQILLYVYHPISWLLFVVFGIGYINCLAAGCYAFYLIRERRELIWKRPESYVPLDPK